MATTDPVTREIVRRLIMYRERLQMTQETLARVSEVSRTTIANIESHRQGIPIPLLYRLSRGLGIDPAELLPPPDELPEFDSPALPSIGAGLESLPRLAEAVSTVLDRTPRR